MWIEVFGLLRPYLCALSKYTKKAIFRAKYTLKINAAAPA